MIYLIDFGGGAFSRDTNFTDFEGTHAYAPPEWVDQHSYEGHAAEIWALGIVLFSLVNGDVPFFNDEQILAAQPSFKGHLSTAVKNLLSKCLSFQPQERPSLEEIQEHPWMTSMDKGERAIKGNL